MKEKKGKNTFSLSSYIFAEFTFFEMKNIKIGMDC
jgi:hypothetical protein